MMLLENKTNLITLELLMLYIKMYEMPEQKCAGCFKCNSPFKTDRADEATPDLSAQMSGKQASAAR